MTEENEVVGVDLSILAQMMLEWEEKKKDVEALERHIQHQVKMLGKTQTVGNVRATYSGGRKKYNYEHAARLTAPQELIDECTTSELVSKTDWKVICDRMEIAKSAIPHSISDPSVKVKLV